MKWLCRLMGIKTSDNRIPKVAHQLDNNFKAADELERMIKAGPNNGNTPLCCHSASWCEK